MSNPFNSDLKRILVIDGYGFRGLGSLIIIDRIVRSASIKAKKPLRPCDIFDLICGTASGALIAILLGRLGLDCDTAMTEYKQLAKAVCGDDSDETQFWENILTNRPVDSTCYDVALSAMIAKHSTSAHSYMSIPKDIATGHTNTSVTITSAEPEITHVVRSYDSPKVPSTPPPSHRWLIREAARAASATPFCMSPIILHYEYSFRGSAFSGFNNPIKLSQRERKILWPNEKNILTVSLGTDISSLAPDIGQHWEEWPVTDRYCTRFVDEILDKSKGPATDPQNRTAMNIVKQVVYAAAETKSSHLEALSTLPSPTSFYYRIDPPLGLDKFAFTDFFHQQNVEDAIGRWADSVEGKAIIAAICCLVVEENKEIKVEDLRKLDPPPPPAGTVNPGYNPRLDKRRPETVLDYLRNYRVLFLIDDSGSMKALWKEARDALSGIADHALKYNADAVDMCFLNSPRFCSRVQGKSFILQIFDEVQPTQGTPTGAVLRKHLREQLDKLNAAIGLPEYTNIRPLDIIVLTDGCPSDKPKICITDAVKEVKERRHHPNCIGIQFVQIGNDLDAKDALQELSYSEEVGMVDTVLYDGNLTSDKLERILLGGLHPNLRTFLRVNRS